MAKEGTTISERPPTGKPDRTKCARPRQTRSGPGRPRDPAKQDAIVAAARDSFFERGFNASTIEDIAQRAGVSKVTLYNRFGDKETLFEAVIRAELGRMTAAFDLSADSALSIGERLNLFGEGMLTHLFDTDHVTFDRLLAQEISQVPTLAERFFRAGPALCRSRLTDAIAQARDEGLLDVDDLAQAADDLMALWKGLGDIEMKFGLATTPTPDEIRQRAARGTRVFLRAYGVSDTKREGDCG
jgi:TetR/AcrR family transcriptional repressor of mexJK operon